MISNNHSNFRFMHHAMKFGLMYNDVYFVVVDWKQLLIRRYSNEQGLLLFNE